MDDKDTIEVEFEITNDDPQMTASFEIDQGIQVHEELEGRDEPDQHPIEAITGLSDALDTLNTNIEQEAESRRLEDENLQTQIDEITVEAVTQVIGGSNIDVIREGPRAYVNSTTFVHEQAQASDTWVIVHNLNKYPSVVIVDSAGTELYPAVHYDSNNQCTITMNGALKGKAFLN